MYIVLYMYMYTAYIHGMYVRVTVSSVNNMCTHACVQACMSGVEKSECVQWEFEYKEKELPWDLAINLQIDR